MYRRPRTGVPAPSVVSGGNDSHLRATAFWMEADELIGWDPDSISCAAASGPYAMPGCYAQVDGKARR
ncbi:MAG: hypothetical protein ACF8K1_03970, partial [Phycisphaerales bacterium JB047]